MRKWTEIVKPYPKIAGHKAYRICIKNVIKAGKTIKIQIEFMDHPQQGRRLTIHLPRPIRPEGLAADYFIACGLEVIPKAEIVPPDTIGSIITATFDKTSDSASWQPVNFKSIAQGESDEPIQSESTINSSSL